MVTLKFKMLSCGNFLLNFQNLINEHYEVQMKPILKKCMYVILIHILPHFGMTKKIIFIIIKNRNKKEKKNEGSRHWGDWQAYFNRPLGINRSEGIF